MNRVPCVTLSFMILGQNNSLHICLNSQSPSKREKIIQQWIIHIHLYTVGSYQNRTVTISLNDFVGVLKVFHRNEKHRLFLVGIEISPLGSDFIAINQSLEKLRIMVDFQNLLNCRYSSKVRWMSLKVCKTLITKYALSHCQHFVSFELSISVLSKFTISLHHRTNPRHSCAYTRI